MFEEIDKNLYIKKPCTNKLQNTTARTGYVHVLNPTHHIELLTSLPNEVLFATPFYHCVMLNDIVGICVSVSSKIQYEIC